MITVNTLVVFKDGLYDDEKETVYRVLEVNGDRVVLELENSNMSIRPQSIALLSDLEECSLKQAQGTQGTSA